MCVPFLIRVVILFLSTGAAFASASFPNAAAAEPNASAQSAAETRTGVLLLKDGGILTGQISQSGDRYVVANMSSEISVPAANVAMICDTLDEAYAHQQTSMQSPTADAHLSLADWCLRFELYPQAAQELLAARGLDPRSPRLELLERRLAVADRPAQPQKSTPASTTDTQPTKAGEFDPASPSTADLPNGVVERFTRKVQPLLVNNCTISGCHRPGGPQSFQLDRAILHGMANRRSTMTNLAAVLALVDHERPRESPLLTVPRRDHGGMNHPIFASHQSAQLQQLVDWVAMVTNSSSDEEAAPAESQQAGAQQAAPPAVEPLPMPPRWRDPVMRVSSDKDGKVHLPSRAEQAAAARLTAEQSADTAKTEGLDDTTLPPFTPTQLRYGARARVWQPNDPFDPEIFNRQTGQAVQQSPPQPTQQHAANASQN